MILSQHPRIQTPPTRSLVKKDSIFGTPAFDVIWGGYDPFIGYIDHWLSWIDINWESGLGIFQKIRHSLDLQLKCDDPRSVRKYLQLLQSLLDNVDILSTVLKLEESAKIPLTEEAAAIQRTQSQYNQVHVEGGKEV